MKIGIDISSIFPPRTGIGNYTLHLARELVARQVEKNAEDIRYEYFLNSFRRALPQEAMFQAPCVQLHHRRLPGPMLLKLWHGLEWPPVDRFVGRVDVFHSPATFIPPQKQGARITTIHDLWFLDHPESCDRLGGRYIAKRLKKVLEQLDAVICVSDFTRNELLERFSFPEDRIFTVYSGVDSVFRPMEKSQARTQLSRESPTPIPDSYILSLSTLEPRKNFAGLIKAYDHLVKENPDTPPLVISGMQSHISGGETESRARKLIQQEPLKSRVIFTGYFPETCLPALYAAAELFVMPSFCEGFGLPILEAMACGTPVACSRGSALDEVAGKSAVRFDPRQPSEIANAIQETLKSDSLRLALSEGGPVQAAQFTWSDCARKTLDVYKKIVAG